MRIKFSKIFLIGFCTLFFVSNIQAFSVRDSLENILNSTDDEKQKIHIQNQLAEIFFKKDLEKALEYIQANLENPHIRNYPKLHSITLYLKGRAHLLASDFEEAHAYLSLAKDFFSKNNYVVELGNCYKDLGTTQLQQNNFNNADAFYQKGLAAYTEANFEAGIAHCNLNLGNVYIEQNLYSKGIQYYYTALDIYERLNMNRYIGMANNNIGNIFLNIKNFEMAKSHYQKAIEAYKVDDDHYQMITVKLNIGASYLDEGKYNKAIQALMEALAEAKVIGVKHPIPMIQNNLAACYINLKNYKSAAEKAKLGHEQATVNGNKVEILNSQILQAEIFLREKKFTSSISKGLDAYQKASKINQLDLMMESSKVLYQAFKATKQLNKSIDFLELHKSHKDSLFNESKMKLPMAKDFEYQLQKQKREQELEQDKARLIWEKKIAIQRILLFCLIIGFLVLGVAAYMIYKNLHAKRNAEAELEQKNKMLEKYIESNIQLEQFAHIASHDLKSPLRTVGSFSSLLKRRASEKLSDTENEYLDMISNAAKLMWNLVDDLMTYSQVNSLQVNVSPNNVNALLQDVKNNLDFSIKEKNAKIEISNMPEVIHVDTTKIRQVFQNLMANSLKFIQDGTPPIIKLDCEDEGSFWKFSVADNGIGIEDNYREKIFKPYKQLHTKAQFDGTGMGLAICKKIVEKHGGEISFESQVGQGTTFFFTIPKNQVIVEEPQMMHETVV